MFALKQIVWAKVRGFPWWPAEIVKLSVNQGPYKVVFIGQDNHAFLNSKQIKKYQENYADLSQKKYKGLQPSIDNANELLQKRKLILSTSLKTKKNQQVELKTKKIFKRGRHKLRGRKPKPKQIIEQPEQKSQNCLQKNQFQRKIIQKQTLKTQDKLKSKLNLKRKYLKREMKQIKNESVSIQNKKKQQELKEKQNQKDESDIDPQMDYQESQIQQQTQKNPIQKQRINAIQQKLFDIITKLNHQEYSSQINYYKSIKEEQLSLEELSQSKITNMLTYIIKKASDLLSKRKIQFQMEERTFVQNLNQKLKTKIIAYLFDTTYYDQYLKLVEKNQHHRSQYQNALKLYLRKNYKIKKEFSQLFAEFVTKQILNGNITNEKQLLTDLKEKNVQINPFNNKTALERSVTSLAGNYK